MNRWRQCPACGWDGPATDCHRERTDTDKAGWMCPRCDTETSDPRTLAYNRRRQAEARRRERRRHERLPGQLAWGSAAAAFALGGAVALLVLHFAGIL